jgi:hydrogenase nickel incorporation protein HypB
VKQINTDGRCHLEAQMISDHLADWDLGSFEYLFIENVGNLVCPSSYDLGEDVRVVLLSVTEGEDKPLKYPNIFNSADIALITKMDLAAACEFDLDAAERNIRAVRPGMRILRTSSKSGMGMEAWLECLAQEKAVRYTIV